MTSSKGKILILQYQGKLLAVLINGSLVLSAQVLKSDSHAAGNIYVGKVQGISRNIAAAFIDLGGGYLTFLPLSEVRHARITNRPSDGQLKVGDELLVQIAKEPMKTKQAVVTTRLSLAGQYVVVSMKTGQKGGVQVSAKLDQNRQSYFRGLDVLSQIAERYTLIVRTNAGALVEDSPLLKEAAALTETLDRIQEIAKMRTCYSCLYRSKPDCITFVENAYRTEYDEVVTDLPEVFDALQETCKQNGILLRFYEDALLPLGKLYSVEARIQELLDKKVWLKSGGYLVIEPTEALISIDVNTGKYEAGKDSEETFFRINMEAAEVIALHLRARNLSGIILIDFINLKSKEKENALLEHMRRLLKRDPVHANALDLTALGLMELTRKKVSPSLAQQLRTNGR